MNTHELQNETAQARNGEVSLGVRLDGAVLGEMILLAAKAAVVDFDISGLETDAELRAFAKGVVFATMRTNAILAADYNGEIKDRMELSSSKAAEYIGCSRTHLTRNLTEIPFHMVGSHRRYTQSDLDAYLVISRSKNNIDSSTGGHDETYASDGQQAMYF